MGKENINGKIIVTILESFQMGLNMEKDNGIKTKIPSLITRGRLLMIKKTGLDITTGSLETIIMGISLMIKGMAKAQWSGQMAPNMLEIGTQGSCRAGEYFIQKTKANYRDISKIISLLFRKSNCLKNQKANFRKILKMPVDHLMEENWVNLFLFKKRRIWMN